MKDPKKKVFSICSFLAGVFVVIGGVFTIIASLKPISIAVTDIMNTHGYDE